MNNSSRCPICNGAVGSAAPKARPVERATAAPQIAERFMVIGTAEPRRRLRQKAARVDLYIIVHSMKKPCVAVYHYQLRVYETFQLKGRAVYTEKLASDPTIAFFSLVRLSRFNAIPQRLVRYWSSAL